MVYNPEAFAQAHARLKQRKQSDFDASYWESKIRQMQVNSGDFNVKDKTISIPQQNLPTMGNMWNEYVKAVQSRGLRPSYQEFVDQYSNLQNLANYNVINTLQSASLAGMSDKQIRKQIKNNPELRQQILDIVKKTPSAKAGEVGYKELASGYLTKPKEGFFQDPMGNLDALGVGAATAYGLSKAGPVVAEKFRGLRGSDEILKEADLKGQKMDSKTGTKILKLRHKEYQKNFKGQIIKGTKKRTKPLSWKEWSKNKKPPVNWTKQALEDAQKIFPKADLKGLGLIKEKASVSSALLKSGKQAAKFLGRYAFPAVAAMQLYEAVTDEE